MATTRPLSPAVQSNLYNHQASNRLVSPIRDGLFPPGDGFRGDIANEPVPRNPVHTCSGIGTHRRCFSAQPAPARCRGTISRDLAVATDLPPHGVSQHLTNCGQREQIPTLTSQMSTASIPQCVFTSCCPGPIPAPRPLQPARSLTDLFSTTAALLARRQPHNAPLLHSAWTVKQVVTEECRILESVFQELGTPTLAAWIPVVGGDPTQPTSTTNPSLTPERASIGTGSSTTEASFNMQEASLGPTILGPTHSETAWKNSCGLPPLLKGVEMGFLRTVSVVPGSLETHLSLNQHLFPT